MQQAPRIPKEKAVGKVTIGIPSYGMVSTSFAFNIGWRADPINMTAIPHHPRYRRWSWEKSEPYQDIDLVRGRFIPVDEARNIIVYDSLRDNSAAIWFRDDDVIAPPDALNRLWYHDVPIIAAPYWSKQKPPVSLILLDGRCAGYEDFSPGEILDVSATGMGCTLIHMDVFRKMKPPWFKTVKDRTHSDEIVGPFSSCTEDVYFCHKARRLGYKILVDTALICQHEEFETDTVYYYHPQWGMPVWQQGPNPISYIGKAGRKNLGNFQEPVPIVPKAVRNDWVYLSIMGVKKLKGYIDVSPLDSAEFSADPRDWNRLKRSFPKVAGIRLERLETLDVNSITPCLNGLMRVLAPGAPLRIITPDLEANARLLLQHSRDDYADAYHWVAGFFGEPSVGKQQLWGFTEASLRSLLESIGYHDIKIWRQMELDDQKRERRAMLVAECRRRDGALPKTMNGQQPRTETIEV